MRTQWLVGRGTLTLVGASGARSRIYPYTPCPIRAGTRVRIRRPVGGSHPLSFSQANWLSTQPHTDVSAYLDGGGLGDLHLADVPDVGEHDQPSVRDHPHDLRRDLGTDQ